MSSTEKQIEEASAIIRTIKLKNDGLSKIPYNDQKIQSELNRDKQFLQGQIRRFNKILRGIQSSYVDPISKTKLQQLKAEARKQIKRNQYLLKKLIKDNNREIMQSDDGGIQMVPPSQQQIHQHDDSEYKMKMMHAQQKSRMIKQFSASIMQIGSIINDTNQMIIEQGQHLDLIEDNVIKTHQNVIKAQQNVTVAQQYQKKSNKLVYIFTGIIVVVAVIVIVVVVLTTKK